MLYRVVDSCIVTFESCCSILAIVQSSLYSSMQCLNYNYPTVVEPILHPPQLLYGVTSPHKLDTKVDANVGSMILAF